MSNWQESLNIDERFSWATEEQRKHILAEIKFQRKQASTEIYDWAIPIIKNLSKQCDLLTNQLIEKYK